MSEPAGFALIQDGKTRYFVDRWASATLRREVIWGPGDFEAWVTQFEQLDEWPEDCCGGAVVDYDKKTLLWCGEGWNSQVPRVIDTYGILLATAWPGFTIRQATAGVDELYTRLGIEIEPDELDDELDEDERQEREEERYGYRSTSLRDVRRVETEDSDSDEDTTDEVLDSDHDDDSELRAWITIIESDGQTRQRQLDELPLNLLKAKPKTLAALDNLSPAEIPREAIVSEGLWLNSAEKTAGIWGSPELLATMTKLGKQWQGWDLKWKRNGYAKQCMQCKTQGVPMSDADALAQILPMILSTQQFNMGSVLGAIGDALGGGVKKIAIKATGCLAFVVCLPLMAFGFFSGNWTAALGSIAVALVVIVGAYLLVARRFKKAVSSKLPQDDSSEASTLVAGPQDEQPRRERIDQLLASAKLPQLEKIEPLFPEATGLELLAT